MSPVPGLQAEEWQRCNGGLQNRRGTLEQARTEQTEALSLAKTVIEHQATAQSTPAAIYIPRNRKLPEFSGRSTNAGELSIEEWVASMKVSFQVMRIPTEDCVEFVKQHLKEEAKATVRFMLRDSEKSAMTFLKSFKTHMETKCRSEPD